MYIYIIYISSQGGEVRMRFERAVEFISNECQAVDSQLDEKRAFIYF